MVKIAPVSQKADQKSKAALNILLESIAKYKQLPSIRQ